MKPLDSRLLNPLVPLEPPRRPFGLIGVPFRRPRRCPPRPRVPVLRIRPGPIKKNKFLTVIRKILKVVFWNRLLILKLRKFPSLRLRNRGGRVSGLTESLLRLTMLPIGVTRPRLFGRTQLLRVALPVPRRLFRRLFRVGIPFLVIPPLCQWHLVRFILSQS